MISTALATALKRNRERLNTRWFLSRPRGEPADFLRAVRCNLDGPVSAIAAGGAAAEQIDRACDALFSSALDHWSQGRLGTDARTDVIAALFQDAFPAVAPVLSERPEETIGAFTHAVLALRRDGSVNARVWIDDMIDLGAVATDLDALRSIGLVMAWRRGLTHARDRALVALSELPAQAVMAIGNRMGIAERSGHDVVARLSRRWRTTRESDVGPPRLMIVGHAGAFEAFGGPFARPPGVSVVNGHLVVGDEAGSWVVHADDFGAVLRPSPHASSEPARAAARVTSDGTISWRGLTATFPALQGAVSWAATSDTLAVACADSHRVRLLAVHGART